MRTRPIFALIATALTALTIGAGTAGAVFAASPGGHAATAQSTTAPHNGGIQLDSHRFCNVENLPCP